MRRVLAWATVVGVLFQVLASRIGVVSGADVAQVCPSPSSSHSRHHPLPAKRIGRCSDGVGDQGAEEASCGPEIIATSILEAGSPLRLALLSLPFWPGVVTKNEGAREQSGIQLKRDTRRAK